MRHIRLGMFCLFGTPYQHKYKHLLYKQNRKWHMGMSSTAHTPKGRGFKTSLGYFHDTTDKYTQNYTANPIDGVSCSGIDLWDTDQPSNKNGTYSGYIYSNRALKIINNFNANDTSKPLFMYLATNNCHHPLEVPQEYLNKFPASWNSGERTYAAMTNFVDEMIGNVTKALKDKNMWENTLLFISSDNGGDPTGNNYPFRGAKFSNFEVLRCIPTFQ